MEFHEDLMFPNLAVADAPALLELLGQAAVSMGFARDDYVQALLEREREFPTGLPVSGGVAIPHTAAEYVTVSTIVVASLTDPVTFHEMGTSEANPVSVSTVFLLLLANAEEHIPMLSGLIRKLQQPDFVQSIRQAPDPAAMAGLLRTAFG